MIDQLLNEPNLINSFSGKIYNDLS